MGGARGGAEDVKKPVFKTNWLTLLLKFSSQTNLASLEMTHQHSVNKQSMTEANAESKILLGTAQTAF